MEEGCINGRAGYQRASERKIRGCFKRKKVWLTFREAGPQHYPYIKDLAQREIGITLRRLPQHKSLLIYQGETDRLYFISPDGRKLSLYLCPGF